MLSILAPDQTLTTATGIVSFNTYASASVTIVESGGVNTDKLRWSCIGH